MFVLKIDNPKSINMKYIILIFLILLSSIFNTQAQFVKPFNESASHFNTPIVIDTNRGKFPTSDMYRAYRKASTGFTTMTKTQKKLEKSIRSFAKSKGKSFIILGSQFAKPPYILGNYPRMEIIFVLIDKGKS